MRLLKWGSKMPSTKQYNLVTNDDYDTRIPLYSDEAFQYGITFQAKYIGSMDVPRPTSRVEIVAAMRRIRYEFKAKGAKKKKVTMEVSVDGVRVTVRKKKVVKKKEGTKLFGGSNSNSESNSNGASTSGAAVQELMHHPIYRIFYVSHDSSDLKIFSYIARDGATNVFKCNVFKSNKKSQAMRIVRTVGQAFEVCHKLSANEQVGDSAAGSSSAAQDEAASDNCPSDVSVKKEAVSECGASTSASAAASTSGVGGFGGGVEKGGGPPRPQKLELLPPPPRKDSRRSPNRAIAPSLNIPELPECVTNAQLPPPLASDSSASGGLSAHHELQLLRERLEQQAQQTRAAVAQLLLLRDQLAAEQAARCEAQARTHQLLVHNKELLDHITALVAHLQERERGTTHTPISVQQLTMVPQMPTMTSQGVTTEAASTLENVQVFNRNAFDANAIINLFSSPNSPITKNMQNMQNNNLSPFSVSPVGAGTPLSTPNNNAFPFNTNISNEQLQNQIINKFQNMGGFPQNVVDTRNSNQQFFQNCNAFPNIPPLTNHYSNSDLTSLFNQNTFFGSASSSNRQSINNLNNLICGNQNFTQLPNSAGQSQNSIYTSSPGPTSASKDSTPDAFSSDDGVPYIMPLSHTTTLRTTDTDGRVRLIVPVSPSGSTSDVAERSPNNSNDPNRPIDNSSNISSVTLKVTDESGRTRPALPNSLPIITRTTSEKVPNRSEMMATMRSQWTRHTTK